MGALVVPAGGTPKSCCEWNGQTSVPPQMEHARPHGITSGWGRASSSTPPVSSPKM
ncbi:hypothetical protein CH063_15266 [Colletotrichum higginsianum]|uniref:Uncharacterized protein n=1 Tax=Colletotrichum higginsianum (strain IMI 349063) TaxID=759273 RepID=H1W236_COLHI|nr:hypothetical protein CH063_15266 [Colletotrichum higginsianum]